MAPHWGGRRLANEKQPSKKHLSGLAAEKVTFDEELADMAEATKIFQTERDYIRQEMEAFWKEQNNHRMHSNTFRNEKEGISKVMEEVSEKTLCYRRST